MKKKLGALILTVSALVISAGCASSGGSATPTPNVPITEESWTKTAPSQLPSRPARPAAGAPREAR